MGRPFISLSCRSVFLILGLALSAAAGQNRPPSSQPVNEKEAVKIVQEILQGYGITYQKVEVETVAWDSIGQEKVPADAKNMVVAIYSTQRDYEKNWIVALGSVGRLLRSGTTFNLYGASILIANVDIEHIDLIWTPIKQLRRFLEQEIPFAALETYCIRERVR